MKHTGTTQIETDRLILRRFKLEDAQQMYDNYTSKPVVTKYLTWQPHKTLDDTKDYLKNFVLPEYKHKDTYRWAIVWKENNQVIGCIDVVDSDNKKSKAELGWVIGDEYWGKGIMAEAAKPVIEHLLKVGYNELTAVHDVANARSQRVMEKIGMNYQGVIKNGMGEGRPAKLWVIKNNVPLSKE